MLHRPYTFDRVVRLIGTGLVLVGLVWVLERAAAVIVPFVLALLVAYLLDPLVSRVQGRLGRRDVAVGITLFGLALLTTGLGMLLVPVITQEVGTALELARDGLREGTVLRSRIDASLPQDLRGALAAVLADARLQSIVAEEGGGSLLLELAGRVGPQLWGLFSGALGVVVLFFQALLVLVYAALLLLDFAPLKARWTEYLPSHFRRGLTELAVDFHDAMARYFRGQFMVALIVGTLATIGFVAIGLKLGVVLGLSFFVLSMVPYLPWLIGWPTALLMALLTAAEEGGAIWPALFAVLAVLLVIEVIQDLILVPRIMGAVTGLRPVLILFAVLFWSKVLGFAGLVLAIPLTCLLLAYYRRLIAMGDHYLESA